MGNSKSWLDLIKEFGRNHELLFYGEVLGHLPSGKNNYRISGGRIYRTQEVTRYEESFVRQCANLKNKHRFKRTIQAYEGQGKEEKRILLGLVANVYFHSWQRDVDTILFCDLLQKAGIIENDRMIRVKLINGCEVDPKNPRIEFALLRLNDDSLRIPGGPEEPPR